MKAILITQLEQPVSIYGNTGTTIPTQLIVSGWTGSTFTISGISDQTVYYTVKVVKEGCEDLIKTFTFTITPTPTPTNSPTPSTSILITWEAVECGCEKKMVCPEGYQSSSDGSYCYAYATATPTQGQPLIANKRTHSAYSNYGARIYKQNGYAPSGAALPGYAPTVVMTRPLWTNPSSLLTEGRLNTVGLWPVDNCTTNNFLPITEWIGFATTINIPQSKLYYIGIAGDNQVRFKVNGYTIVEQPNISDLNNFKYWHIYPVYFQDGTNFIELSCKDDGSISATLGAEIYDNTESELISATTQTQLNILFSTKDYFCSNITVGTNYGYNCPDGYTLDLTDGPVCKKRVEIAPTEIQTGYVHCKGRRRLVNGISDGYYEPNNNAGLGPLFPDTLNPDLCVVSGVNPTPTPTASVALTPTPTVTPTVTPSSTQQFHNVGCIIYPVDAQVETITVAISNLTIEINISGLAGGSYGVGSIYTAFNIASNNCRPCTTITGTMNVVKRGTLEVYPLQYRITPLGGIYFVGFLPLGFVYDGLLTDNTNCDEVGGGSGCLIKGTQLTMADGAYKNIEDVKDGDMLMSLHIEGLNDDENINYHNWSSTTLVSFPSITTVRGIKKIMNKRVYRINDVLVASGEHKHFIKRNDVFLFERADSIRKGDLLMYEKGTYILVNTIVVQDGIFETYILDVEDLDVYFANGLLTHNKELIG
jgi:hypothetical protein